MIITGAGKLNKSTGLDRLLAFTSDGDCYIYDASYSPVWRRQWLGLTASQKVETQAFLDMLFVVNGLTDAPRSYSGLTTALDSWSTTTNVTDMPKAKYIKALNGRLYLFNINIPVGGNFPSRSWFCDLPKNDAITWDFESGTDLVQTSGSAVVTSAGALFQTRGIKPGDAFFIATGTNAGQYTVDVVDSETQITLTEELDNTQSGKSFWVGGNWFDVERDNSDVGMGIGANFNRVLFFKRHSVHKFQKTQDVATDNLLPIKGAPGTTSHKSIVDTPAYTYWWSDTGLWRTDGVSAELISMAQQEVVDGIADGSLDDVVGWFEKDRIIKMFIGDVSNATTGLTIDKAVLCYDTFNNTQWTESLAHTVNAVASWVNGTGKKKNYLFTASGKVFETQSGNSHGGEPIYMEIETHPYFAISPEFEVNYTRIRVYGEDLKSLDVLGWKKIYYDKGLKDSEPIPVKTEFHTENEIVIKPPESKNKCAGFVLLFSESTDTQRPVINRITAHWTGGEMR